MYYLKTPLILTLLILLFLTVDNSKIKLKPNFTIAEKNYETNAFEVIDKYLNAIGGEDKLKEVKSITWTIKPSKSKFNPSKYGISGLKDFTITQVLKRQGNSILSSSYMKAYGYNSNLIMLNKIVYNGRNAKSIRKSFPGGVSYPDVSSIEKDYANSSTLFFLENYKASKILKNFEYKGTETLNDIEYHKVTYNKYSGYYGWRIETVYFDVSSSLMAIRKTWTASNKVTYDFYSDYKEFKGIKIPTKKYIGLTETTAESEIILNSQNIPSNAFSLEF